MEMTSMVLGERAKFVPIRSLIEAKRMKFRNTTDLNKKRNLRMNHNLITLISSIPNWKNK